MSPFVLLCIYMFVDTRLRNLWNPEESRLSSEGAKLLQKWSQWCLGGPGWTFSDKLRKSHWQQWAEKEDKERQKTVEICSLSLPPPPDTEPNESPHADFGHSFSTVKKSNGLADKDPFQLHTACARRSPAARCSAIVAEAEDGRCRSCGGTWTGRTSEASQSNPRTPESAQIQEKKEERKGIHWATDGTKGARYYLGKSPIKAPLSGKITNTFNLSENCTELRGIHPFCLLLNILWVLNMQPFAMLQWAHILYHLKPVRYLLNFFLSPSKHIKEGQIPDVHLMKHQINKETLTKQVADLQDSAENSGFDGRKTQLWTPAGRKTLLENTALCRWWGNLCRWRIFHIENAE